MKKPIVFDLDEIENAILEHCAGINNVSLDEESRVLIEEAIDREIEWWMDRLGEDYGNERPKN